MSSVDAFDTIEQYIRANWTEDATLVFENEPFDRPGVPAPFLFIEIVGFSFDQASIGADPRADNLWREEGFLNGHVMVPNGTGSREARRIAGVFAALFKGEDIGSLTFLDASIGAGDPGRAFANYWAMTASIEWRRDE